MSSFRSPFHFHILSLRNLSQHYPTYLQEERSKYSLVEDEKIVRFLPRKLLFVHPYDSCYFCGKDFEGSTSIYCCEKCRFYIHTWCAAPPRQIQHPRHEHPLDLQIPLFTSWGFNYKCVECHFKLDAGTVMKTLWVEKYYCAMLQEAGDGESRLQFAHEHQLTSFPVRTRIFCGGCQIQISEEAYGCSECNFHLHEACAKAPPEIQSHPFHPEHPLYLFCNPGDLVCHICGNRSNIGYRCIKCPFSLDLSCAREVIRTRSSVMDHYLHRHQLSSYHSKTQTKIKCHICREQIPSGEFFGCLDCSFYLHESCAQPPAHAIQHYVHPEHTLTFAKFPEEKEHECPICESPIRSDSYCYTCQMCDFFIHKTCASATLSDLEKGVSVTVQFSFHEHELKLYYNDDWRFCKVCGELIMDKTLAYKCFSQGCRFELHKSCLQPPSNLVHPSHSLHPLTLCFEPPDICARCGHCSRDIRGLLAFSCGECNFYLDIHCAKMPSLKHPFHEHKHPFHEHKLLYLGRVHEDLECSACRKSCHFDLLRCKQCDFNLHYDCSQLPPTIKSEHHIDPLVLRESIIEDESGEYYCDICERRRDEKKWVYYCEDCTFVAHVECASSLVKLELIEEDDFICRKEDIQRQEEELKRAQEQVNAKEESLRPLMVELESMRAKLESQRAELEELKTELAKSINKEVIEKDESLPTEEDYYYTDWRNSLLRAKLEGLENEQANWIL